MNICHSLPDIICRHSFTIHFAEKKSKICDKWKMNMKKCLCFCWDLTSCESDCLLGFLFKFNITFSCKEVCSTSSESMKLCQTLKKNYRKRLFIFFFAMFLCSNSFPVHEKKRHQTPLERYITFIIGIHHIHIDTTGAKSLS